MRFNINLASQPHEDVQRFLARWGLALFAVALLTAGLIYASVTAYLSWRVTDRQIAELRTQIADRDQKKAQVQAFLAKPENRETRDRSEFLNQLLARKAFSWTEVFTDLEKLVPPRLHVLSIKPDINADQQVELRLLVAGSSRDAAIELQRRLEQSPHFMNPRIVSESARNASRESADTVQFDISAIYVPAFARNRKTGAAEQQQASAETATEARR